MAEDRLNDDDVKQAIHEWTMGPGNSARRLEGRPFMPDKDTMALRSSWHTEPMPLDNVKKVKLGIPLSEEELRYLALGHIPDAMEDHWFMYFDGDSIRYYRSWTGLSVYAGRVAQREGEAWIDYVVVNREFEQASDFDDAVSFIRLVAAEIGVPVQELVGRMEAQDEPPVFAPGSFVREAATGELGKVMKGRLKNDGTDVFFHSTSISIDTPEDEAAKTQWRWDEGWRPEELTPVPGSDGVNASCDLKDVEYIELYWSRQGFHRARRYAALKRAMEPGTYTLEFSSSLDKKRLSDAEVADFLRQVREALRDGLDPTYWREVPQDDRFFWNLELVAGDHSYRSKGESELPDAVKRLFAAFNQLLEEQFPGHSEEGNVFPID